MRVVPVVVLAGEWEVLAEPLWPPPPPVLVVEESLLRGLRLVRRTRVVVVAVAAAAAAVDCGTGGSFSRLSFVDGCCFFESESAELEFFASALSLHD